MTTHELHRLYPEWHLVRPLGEGAFGKVYEIRRGEGGMEERAALKVIHIPQSESDVTALRSQGYDDGAVSAYYKKLAEQLSGEVITQAKLKGHSNIVSYEDRKTIQDPDGVGYTILIRMELLTPLTKLMATGPLPQADVLQLGLDMAQALALCERHHIIHRDIKPQNIFLSPNGDYKLGDFGVARELEKTTYNMTRAGTNNYMAPEVFHGRPCNATVDIYSLGIVLYALLNGNRPPFVPPPGPEPDPSASVDALHKRLSGEAIPLLSGVPDVLNEVILKMCAFAPKDRYQNARELAAALESAALELRGEKTVSLRSWIGDNTPSVAPSMDAATEDEGSRWIDGTPVMREKAPEPVPEPEPTPVSKKSRGKVLVAALVGVVVVLAGVVAWMAVRGRPEPVVDVVVSTSAETTTTMPQLNYSVGDIVQFGQYDWRVLDIQDDKALLLSEDIVEQRAYNTEWTDVTWETCTLRAYLNGEFYEKFSEEDRARIALTHNENPDNTWGVWNSERLNTPGGVSTNDRIFLLSVPEVVKYYPGLKLHKDSKWGEGYYEADGRIMAKFNNNRSWYWLRSPGQYQYIAAYVTDVGEVRFLGNFVNLEIGGVRPTMWVEATAIAEPAAVTTTTTTQPTTTSTTTTTATTKQAIYVTNKPYTVTLLDGETGTVSFTGYWYNEMPEDNREGTYVFVNGSVYVGNIKNGLPNGQGTFTHGDGPNKGDKYVGSFKNNLFNGQGTYTWANGKKYVGEWKDGQSNGQGTMTMPDGRKYEGEWKDSRMNGYGIMYSADGTITQQGQWKYGIFIG